MISYSEPEEEYWKYQRCNSGKIFVGRGYSCLASILMSFSSHEIEWGKKCYILYKVYCLWEVSPFEMIKISQYLPPHYHNNEGSSFSWNFGKYFSKYAPSDLRRSNLDSVVTRKSYLKTHTFFRTALFWAITQRV